MLDPEQGQTWLVFRVAGVSGWGGRGRSGLPATPQTLTEAELEIPGTASGYCSPRLVATLGKRSDFKTFSGICARKQLRDFQS